MTDVLLCCICVKAAFQTHQAKHTPFKKKIIWNLGCKEIVGY